MRPFGVDAAFATIRARRCSPVARRARSTNPEGRYQLFRVADAVASRNIYAAIYDSLRLCKAF
jgi:hypothetical protein